MPPLLSDIAPQLQGTDEKKAFAIALGRAMVTALYGDQFGADFVLDGKSAGLQNYNNDIRNRDGSKIGFYGIQRGGQGEPTDEASQLESMERWKRMVAAGHPVPEVVLDMQGNALPKLPDTVQILEQVIRINDRDITVPAGEYPVPGSVKGLTVITQKSFDGEPITKKDAEDFRRMGELIGGFHAVSESHLMERMETNPLPSPVEIFPRGDENPALQVLILKSMGLKGQENIQEVIKQLSSGEGAAVDSVARVVADLDRKVEEGQTALGKMETSVREAAEASLNIVRELRDKIENENWFETTLRRYEKAVTDLEAAGYADLPVRPGHGDFHFGNMERLKDGDPLKEAGHDYVMFDLMGWQGDMTRVWDLMQPLAINGAMTETGSFDPERAQAYVEGVLSKIELTEAEIKAIPVVLEHMHLRSTATRLTSFMLSEHTHQVTKTPVELLERMDRFVEDGHNRGDWAQKAYDAHQARKDKAGPGADAADAEVEGGVNPKDRGSRGAGS